MANYYVSPGGSDITGDGSSGNRWQTIQYAITQMSSNDTLYCGDGTYNESTSIGTLSSKNITIESENLPSAGGDLNVVVNCPNADEDWILIDHSNPSSVTLKGLKIYKANTANYHGLIQCSAAAPVSGADITITYCHIYSNSNSGKLFALYNGFYNVKLYKNTIRYFYAGCWDNCGYNLDVRDCILTDCERALDATVSGTFTHTNNVYYNNSYDIYDGSLNVSEYNDGDPLFADSGYDEGRLKDGSFLVDQGVTIASYVESYSGDAPDIGWYEKSGAATEGIYIDPSGNDSTGDGTSASPFQTFNKALSVIYDGQIIYAKNGTYNSVAKGESTGKEFILRAENMPSPGGDLNVTFNLEDVNDHWIEMDSTADILIEGIRVYNPHDSNYNGMFHATNANAVVKAKYCHFYASGISKNIVFYNYMNTTAYKCTFRSVFSIQWDNHTVTDFQNCIFEGIDRFYANESASYTFNYNSTYDVNGSIPSGSNNITDDPTFQSGGDDEGRIESDSPCVDAGTTIVGEITEYSGSDPDIGWYEVSGVALPTVSTQSASGIGTATATLNGTIDDTGGEDADERGFVYGTSSHGDPGNVSPDASDYSEYTNESGTFGAEVFDLGVSSLAVDTTHYVRAYAHNSEGYSYGDEVYFSTLAASTIESSFTFKWFLKRTVQSLFDWSWKLIQQIQSSFTFSWKIVCSQRFYHVTTFPLFLMDTPTTSTLNFTAPVTGILDSVVVDLGSTGASGSTVIKVYLDDVLKTTKTVTADGTVYNSNTLLDGSLMYRDSIIKVDITSVATGATDLRVAVQERTCPPNVGIRKIYNVKNTIQFSNSYLFGSSDEWILILNQPIQSVVSVHAEIGGWKKSLSLTLATHDFYQNKITLTPVDLSTYNNLILTIVDLNGETQEVHVPIQYRSKVAEYPTYTSASFSMRTYLETQKVYYSWNNTLWYSTTPINGKVPIGHIPTTEGTYTLYIRYFLNTSGTQVVYDTASVICKTGDAEVSIDVGNRTISSSDSTPLDKVEIYKDGELQTTVDLSISVDGFNSYSYNTTTRILTMDGGTISYKGSSITFNSQDYTIATSWSMDDFFLNKVLYFDTESRELSLEDISSGDRLIYDMESLATATKIPLWWLVFTSQPTYDNEGTLISQDLALAEAQRVFIDGYIPPYFGEDVYYVLYDIAGRTKEIHLNVGYPDSKDYSYYLVVKDGSSNTIKPGQIHQESTLYYYIEER